MYPCVERYGEEYVHLHSWSDLTLMIERQSARMWKITNDGLAQNVLCCCRCQVLKSAELVGYFVSADVWSKMVLNNVKMSQSSASLSVVAAVIRGSEPTQLSRHLTEITVVIADPSISHIADVCFAYCTLWLSLCQFLCLSLSDSSAQLFIILWTVDVYKYSYTIIYPLANHMVFDDLGWSLKVASYYKALDCQN